MKKDICGVDYLEQMLKWAEFCRHHPNFSTALREVLDELYELREGAKK